MSSGGTAAFVHLPAHGHMTPTYPVARWLVKAGWHVHYLSYEPFRGRIEETGAVFHSEREICREFYEIGPSDADYDVTARLHAAAWADAGSISLSEGARANAGICLERRSQATNMMYYLLAKGAERWLANLFGRDPSSRVKCVVFYDPWHSFYAKLAADLLQIPSVSLVSIAGPGAVQTSIGGVASAAGVTEESLLESYAKCELNTRAIDLLETEFGAAGLRLQEGGDYKKWCTYPSQSWERIYGTMYAETNIVNSCKALAAPLDDVSAAAHSRFGHAFVFTGPLMEEAGADDGEDVANPAFNQAAEALEKNRNIRRLIYVSMGTVATSTEWDDCPANSIPTGHMCRAVHQAVFDVFGSEDADPSSWESLICSSIGSREDAMHGCRVPANAIVYPWWPQQKVLGLSSTRAFVTHCGQGSLMESLSKGVPVVACPCFGDQHGNATTVERVGVGLQVVRPGMEAKDHAVITEDLKSAYTEAVRTAVRRVAHEADFAIEAAKLSKSMASEGGTRSAAQELMSAADKGGGSDRVAK